jgi:integrase
VAPRALPIGYFPAGANAHLTPASPQQACRDSVERAGLRKRITVHSLRHYAEFRTMPSKLAGALIFASSNRQDSAY